MSEKYIKFNLNANGYEIYEKIRGIGQEFIIFCENNELIFYPRSIKLRAKRNRKYEIQLDSSEIIQIKSDGHYSSADELLWCKRKILQNQKKVLLRYGSDVPFSGICYDSFKDINHITYGYEDSCNHQLVVFENDINGLVLGYRGVIFSTNLLTAFHARNISCALAILSEINELDMTRFSEFAKSIRVRGRFEKMEVNNKTVILDTGQAGLAKVFNGLDSVLKIDSYNPGNPINNNMDNKYKGYRVIYSNTPDDGTERTKRNRRLTGSKLTRARHVYLTSFYENSNDLQVFTDEVKCDSNISFEYIANMKDAVIKALADLGNDEVLVIITKSNYRRYKNILEDIKSGVISSNAYNNKQSQNYVNQVNNNNDLSNQSKYTYNYEQYKANKGGNR